MRNSLFRASADGFEWEFRHDAGIATEGWVYYDVLRLNQDRDELRDERRVCVPPRSTKAQIVARFEEKYDD